MSGTGEGPRDTEQLVLSECDPRVSLVIVHYRTPELLRVSLQKIMEARIEVGFEVVVIDNAPLDDAAESHCASQPGITYLRNEKNLGFGRAVNQGIARARGEFALILNPDVEVQPGSVEELIAQMDRDRSVGLIAPKLLYPDGTLQHSCRRFYTLSVFLLRRTFLGKLFPNHRLLREHLMLDEDHDTTRPVDWCIGASLLARKTAVVDVGPMDERFFLYFEDVDWCYRMAARGWKVVYHPASCMIHRYQRASARRPGKGLLIHLASTLRYYEKWSFILYWLKRRSATIRRVILVLSDLAAINLAFVLAYVTRILSSSLLVNPTFGFDRYTRLLGFANIVALFALALAGMYRSRRREEAGEQFLGAFRATLATGLIIMAATFLFFEPAYSRAVIGLFLLFAFVLILLFRWGIFRAQGEVRSRRLHLRRIGILAPEEETKLLLDRLQGNPDLGIEFLPLTSRAAVLEASRGGRPSAVEEAIGLWVADERIAEVVLFEDWSGADPANLIERLAGEGIPVRLVPRTRHALRHGVRSGDFFGYPSFQIAGASAASGSWEKRLLDSIGAGISILLLFVPYLLVRFILLLSGRRVQAEEWLGRRGEIVRSTRLPGTWPRGALFTGIQEFPKLWLWLRGKWSLVGIFAFDSSCWSELPTTYQRFPPDAVPGWITLAGGRRARPTHEMCAANTEYASRWSLALDMTLLLERLRRTRGMS